MDTYFLGWREATDEWVKLRHELASAEQERDEVQRAVAETSNRLNEALGATVADLERAEQERYAAGHKALKAKVFMTVGAREHPDMTIDLPAFHTAVRSHQYEGSSLRSTIEPDQNHNTVFPFRLTNGLRFIHGIGTNAP